ncbi:cation-translocating P-type ATPase [Amycolatopsis sp. DG1A-15b]|uniref:cation-translocating P-type ATPase n=1 Tax=Amycolatopsis sp. DG1A-15b TaxID=3052846 RepID=UPI00255B96E3|nr:cation-translocating P-type ATPase [Amycolatopsis sp. DG1A-15b]WIX89967.1 cation-translocating P-type ATPase [Amycolatopsis sp. DG1A-15b]
MLEAVFTVTKAGMTLALAGPVLVTQQAKRAVSAIAPLAGELAAGAAGTAAEATRTSSRTAVRAARVVRNAAGPRSAVWRAGRRLHVPLRPGEHADRPDGPALAAELAAHADVAGAYWDSGLGSVVLHLAEEATADRVLDRIAERCERHGLTPAEPGDSAPAHPGDTYGVRTAALALAMDVAGLAVSVGTRAVRSGRLHEAVRAAVSAAREHPTVRAALDEQFGWYTAELARSGVSAAVRGLSQDPLELVLDALLRTGQLTEAIARLTAFDAGHDDLCSPERPSLGVTPPQRRVRIPMEDYARNAVGSGLLAALADLLVRRNPREAAEAFLAASPMPARYADTAFHTAMGTAFAREGVLVRDPDRLKALDTVDTVVLHADALHGEDGLDPHAEAVLDAARRAEARVVIAGDDARDRLGEFASLADDVARESFFGLVTRLQDEGRVVLTVGRPPARCAPNCDEVAGLLAGDLCVALADRNAPVLWGADLVVRPGLTGVWRVLRAAGAARLNSTRATRVATAGSLIGGLLLMSRRRRTLVPFVPRLDPVLLGGLTGLAMGTLAAARVAAARPPAGRTRIAWHELTGDEVLRRLADAEPEPTNWELTARRVRAVTGAVARHPAAAPVRFGTGLAADVVAELNDPLTPVLALGAVASAVVGSPVDALLVAAAMGLNAVVGGAQQFRGRRALAKLRDGERQRARRVGGGVVDARALKAGDRIELRVGDVVPADARLLTANDLEADESALTGESLPVAKQLDPVPGAPMAERSCLVFAGTTVVSGEGTAVVVAVGSETVAGRAVELATRTAAAVGIQARLQDLTRRALPLTMLGGALVTGLSAIRGRPLRRALAGGVAIAVAAVPEGLPLVATVAQRAAARRLSARGILVRAPRALEALGRLDVVCFDKTGTLTENRLRVVTTTGPGGEAREPGPGDAVLRAAARACPGTLDDPHVRAHATDHAVLAAAGPDNGWTELAGQPFEANRGYSATVGRDGDGEVTLVVKGAPEIVLPACAGADELARAAEVLADKGLRVLAVASRKAQPALDGDDAEVLADLEFLGFLGLADTLRPTAEPLISGLRAAGVSPVMLTGDHPNTARAIATSLGWPSDAPVVTGDELAALDRAGRARLLSGAGVIARVAPEQKLQVVEALREAGRVTAMVGDGANDAAAIRAADVGIGVRARASTAARTAADVALTDEDLTVLLEAVAEGRALWRSVSDAVVILVGGNAGEIGFSVLGTLLSGDSPLGTRQLLLVNLLTDLFPAMAVAVTRPDDDGGSGPGGLGDGLTRAITSRGVTTGVGATTAWLIGRFTPGTVRRTSTMALCGLVGTQLAQTLRGRRRSPLVVGTAVGSALVLAAIVQTPGVSRFFGCTPLGPLAWAGVGAGVATGALTSSLPILRQP